MQTTHILDFVRIVGFFSVPKATHDPNTHLEVHVFENQRPNRVGEPDWSVQMTPTRNLYQQVFLLFGDLDLSVMNAVEFHGESARCLSQKSRVRL